MPRITAATQAAFEAALSSALKAEPASRVFVLFTGSSDASGHSWCPDCNDCKPLLKSVFEEAGAGTTLVEVPLERSEYSGNAKHWARVHPSSKLQRIPTLMKWGKVNKVAELVEGECADASRVRELVLDE
jgi:hypothetical protein